MDGWEDYLHITFLGEHVLFPSVRLTSFSTFVSAAALSATICLTERCVLLFLAADSRKNSTQRHDTFPAH
jgi:hypothetical protein